MECLICAIIVCGAIMLLKKIISCRNEEAEDNNHFNGMSNMEMKPLKEEYPSTSSIVYDALCSIGCQPELKDERTIVVSYQGETFQLDFGVPPSRYVRVWDPCWARIEINDPQVDLIKEAVNISNYNFGPTVLITQPDEENMIMLYSRYDIMIHPTCPENDLYIHAVLESFFMAKEEIRNNIQNLNVHQNEQQRNRRPVGFVDPQ